MLVVTSRGTTGSLAASVLSCPGISARISRALVLIALMPVHAAVAQLNNSVKHSSDCGQCRITITQVATLGVGIAVPLLSQNALSVAADSRGRFFVATHDGSQISVHAANGTLLRTIGRRGEGPGEFDGSISRVLIGETDTIYVFGRGGRLDIFSPDLQFVRRMILPGAGAAQGTAILADGRILLRGTIRSPERIGYPLHVLSNRGAIDTSLGYDGKSPIAVGSGQAAPHMRVGPDRATLWSARAVGHSYELLRLRSGSWRLDTLIIDEVPWLNEPLPRLPIREARGFGRAAATVAEPPLRIAAELSGIDSSGLLWIQVSKPIAFDSSSNAYRYAWRIEVYDPLSRRALATTQLAEPLRFIDGTTYAYIQRTDELGVVTYTVFSVRLTR